MTLLVRTHSRHTFAIVHFDSIQLMVLAPFSPREEPELVIQTALLYTALQPASFSSPACMQAYAAVWDQAG